MEDVRDLLAIPDDPLLHVLSFLNYQDLTTCSRVCRRLYHMSNCQTLWRRQCCVNWDLHRCDDGVRWKDCFVTEFHNFGQYIDIYRPVHRAWTQIKLFVEQYCPEIWKSLAGGLSEEDLNTFERQIQLQLPADYRCSLRICGGQICASGNNSPGLMGSITLDNLMSAFIHTPLLTEALVSPTDVQQLKHNTNQGVVCLTSTPISCQMLAVSDRAGFLPGQVFYTTHIPMDIGGEFLTASSFLQWLTAYAQQLADGIFPVVSGHIMRYQQDPSATVITGGIRVSVLTVFTNLYSTIEPPVFKHLYNVIISMDADASPLESCQLESQHWTMTDEDGCEEKLDGLTAVGEHPIMRPGATYSWTSGTTFTTTYGNMRGYFLMRNLQTGAEMRVDCPLFHLKCLPYQTFQERQERCWRSKKEQ